MATSILTLLVALAAPPEPPLERPPQGCMAAYTPSTSFCDGRVYPEGGRGHISWEAFATAAAPEVVIADTLARCGKANHDDTADRQIWRFPVADPKAVVSVSPAAAEGPWSRCEPAAGTKTIIVVSRFP